MLPEHVEALKNMFAEQAYQKKPILDEQQMMENESILKHAIHDHLMIKIKYFKDHDFQMVQGEVANIVDDHLWIGHQKIHLRDIIEVHYM